MAKSPASYPTRVLGRNGPAVSALGLGCMGMSEFYGTRDDQQSIQVIHRALDMGMNFIDTADMYGVGDNERLLGQAIAGRRKDVFLATKFGNVRGPDGAFLGVSGTPEYVRSACDASLKRLGVDVIDLYYQHRVDINTPIEQTIGAMADLVKQGKVRYLGMSEAGPDTIRRAAKVHPIAALQTEYSLWSRDPEAQLIPTCRELGIAFVPYSPLGRGFLTGAFASPSDLPANDRRHVFPRFQGENFQANLAIVQTVKDMAAKIGCTASQIALAWLLHQGPDIIPIPGTKRLKYLEDNAGAAAIKLSREDVAHLSALIPAGAAAGGRYYDQAMASLNR
jgi:aryl-alcohol dehydrogenase-like predicted oxidoreductase